MSQSDQSWRYAEAAMLGACCSKNETEKRALLDLTRTLAKAALESEGGTDARSQKCRWRPDMWMRRSQSSS